MLNCAKKVKPEDGNQNVKSEECPASMKNAPNTGSGENKNFLDNNFKLSKKLLT